MNIDDLARLQAIQFENLLAILKVYFTLSWIVLMPINCAAIAYLCEKWRKG